MLFGARFIVVDGWPLSRAAERFHGRLRCHDTLVEWDRSSPGGRSTMSAGTPRRSVRVEDELWNQAHAKAAREGTTVAARVRAGLREYVQGP